VIEDVAVLDLTTMTPEALSRIKSIRDVATVLVPESLGPALAAIPMKDVANVVPVPDGARINAHTGVLTLDGAGLASGGDEPAVLIVTGALVITSPVERVGFRDVLVIGVLVAPEGSEAALTGVLRRVTGTVFYYPWTEGQAVRVFQGDTRVRGEILANAGGSPDDIALAAGSLLVTTPVERVGFRSVVVVGMLLAPEESELVLGPAATVVGSAVWYTAPPRFFNGKERFSAAFFELLDGPVTLALNGSFEVAPDVPVELVKRRVAAIVLNGALRASAGLVPLLQVLATHKNGVIETLDEER
jgi:hypothetical protein